MIDWKEITDGDDWELFARDFLGELGFVVEVGPGRGADAGRDLLVSEQLKGRLRSQPFRWLVSCKHFAVSGKSVGPGDEVNITDRLKQHDADGFMGFYSTMPSSGLVERLHSYENSGSIKSHEIFDGKKIEARFVDTGLSKLALRYFPQSYLKMRPIQTFLSKRVELNCEICGKDLLASSVTDPYSGILVWAAPRTGDDKYHSLHLSCKGQCDRRLEARLAQQGYTTHWEDIGDLCNPIIYLKNMMTYMNMLKADASRFSDEAHQKMKEVYIGIGQRTLREITVEDAERLKDVNMLDGFM